MDNLLSSVQIQVGPKIFLKDPETSDLGRKIISGSIDVINEIGFEAFTFRKLGIAIQSPEASIYRYFENKNKLLLYLTSWYWAWMEYNLVFTIANVKSPKEKLERALSLLTSHRFTEDHRNFPHIKIPEIFLKFSDFTSGTSFPVLKSRSYSGAKKMKIYEFKGLVEIFRTWKKSRLGI